MSQQALPSPSHSPAWRQTAAKVVEELFPACSAGYWDDLLDLRGMLLYESDWSSVLEAFLTCRRKMEEDHYLPFYRLRGILAAHLRLENGDIPLASLLRQPGFSFRRWQLKTEKSAARGTRPVRLVENV